MGPCVFNKATLTTFSYQLTAEGWRQRSETREEEDEEDCEGRRTVRGLMVVT